MASEAEGDTLIDALPIELGPRWHAMESRALRDRARLADRAGEHFRARLQDDHDTATRCGDVGVGARTRQFAFAHRFGSAPPQGGQRERLARARRALRCAGPGASVVERVAPEYGCRRSRRSSRPYLRQSGELPSRILLGTASRPSGLAPLVRPPPGPRRR